MDVVLEDGGLVHGREVASREDVEQRSLPARSVAATWSNLLIPQLPRQDLSLTAGRVSATLSWCHRKAAWL